MNDASFLPTVGDQSALESQEKLAQFKAEAFGIVQEWAKGEAPKGTIQTFLVRHEASPWLKENIAGLDYKQLEDLAKSDDSHQSTAELRKAQLAGELKNFIDKVVTPVVAIKTLGKEIKPEEAEAFGLWIKNMLVGTSQNEVSHMISVAENYCPALILQSQREYWQEEGDPEDSHRTEKATGPLLAASLTLEMGEKGEISISDDEENRGGLGHTTSADVSFK